MLLAARRPVDLREIEKGDGRAAACFVKSVDGPNDSFEFVFDRHGEPVAEGFAVGGSVDQGFAFAVHKARPERVAQISQRRYIVELFCVADESVNEANLRR
jgi:hypothetical protein